MGMAPMNLEAMSWRDKLDYLELNADVGLVPVIVALRFDMELFAVAASRFVEAEALLSDVRRQLLDLIAVRQEHRAA
jgi:hypothetical protein